MVRIEGKIILHIHNTEAMEIKELSEEEKIKLFEVEMELNDRVDREMAGKYGISIRVHL